MCMDFIGYLCGKCRNDAGVSALLNKCVSCGNVNILLIIALGMSAIRIHNKSRWIYIGVYKPVH